MDLLTDILQDAGLRRRVLNLSELPDDVALQFPCDRSIGLHVVVRGNVHLHTGAFDAPLLLGEGDIAVMARGRDHVLAVPPDLAALRPMLIGDRMGPGKGCSTVISGAFQLWNDPLHPFFAELPPWFVLRAAERSRHGPLALTAQLIEAEFRCDEPGADSVVHALLDVVFTYALRQIALQRGASRTGWSHAVRDVQIRRALTLMHEDIAYRWTLEELAQRAGLSRTVLAERFRDAMGDTPLNHLRTLRMQRAMKLLSESARNLETVAAAVGYQDAFSFSKVFKRIVGVAPKAFRQRDAADRSHPWRFVGDQSAAEVQLRPLV